MKVNGIQEKIQKRVILCTLKEAYQTFKDEYPDKKIGFTKFAMLKPKKVVLPGSSGTHNISVCTTHQIFNLLLGAASRIVELNLLLGLEYFSEKIATAYFLAAARCNPPSLTCCMAKCCECASKLQQLYYKSMKITFKSRQSSDCTTSETYVKSEDEFANLVIEKLKMHPHDFV